MAFFFSPVGNSQIQDANGNPLVGGTISTFLAGTSTPETTYTDDTGGTAQGPVITLNSLGSPTLGPIWLEGGVPLKFIIKDAGGVTLYTYDDIVGIGDVTVSADQFPFQTGDPTYISATSFSVLGDQTTELHQYRRLKSINTGGTVYSTISSSAFLAGVTTVTVLNTSGVLDTGLSQVNYSLLTNTNPAIPESAIGTLLRTASTTAAGRSAISAAESTAIRSLLAGCTMSTAGSSTTMSIAAGIATDTTNTNVMSLSAIAKTTSNWAVGTAAGGKSLAAAIANNTWYHFYVIRRPDTGVVDVCFSTNAAGLLAADFVAGGGNVPDAYTQFRRIGSMRTNGSAQWESFVQDGDLFNWSSPVADFTVTNPTNLAVLRALKAPLGLQTIAILNVSNSGTTLSSFYFSDPATTDIAATNANAQVSLASSSTFGNAQIQIRTNTSSQIRARASVSDASTLMVGTTTGYIDKRGKDA